LDVKPMNFVTAYSDEEENQMGVFFLESY
jgi:hypothetical protein